MSPTFPIRIAMCLVCLSVGAAVGYVGPAAWGTRFDLGFATLLVDSGYTAEAAKLLEARRHNAPWDAHSTMLLARTAAADGDLARCADLLGSVADGSPLKAEALLREGQCRMQLHDAATAEDCLLRTANHPLATPEIADQSWRELAKLYGTEDRVVDLREALWKIWERSGENERAAILQRVLDSHLLREEPLVRAEKLRELAAGNPRDLRARTALGLALLEANKTDEAMEILRQCRADAPDDVDAWRAWLRGVYQRGDVALLDEELARAPLGLQQESGFWKLRATAAQERGSWDEASECLANAIAIAPFDCDLRSQYAVVLARQGQRTLAEEQGRIAGAIREDQGQLRVAYEDWLAATNNRKPLDTLIEIAERIAAASRTCGYEKQAEAWSEVAQQIRQEKSDRAY